MKHFSMKKCKIYTKAFLIQSVLQNFVIDNVNNKYKNVKHFLPFLGLWNCKNIIYFYGNCSVYWQSW